MLRLSTLLGRSRPLARVRPLAARWISCGPSRDVCRRTAGGSPMSGADLVVVDFAEQGDLLELVRGITGDA
jgi:hypothetical protein